MTRCQGTLPPTFGTRNGWPNETRVRCHRTLGVQTWQGSHGQMMVACPQHRKQVEALDRPYQVTNLDPVYSMSDFGGCVVGPGETGDIHIAAERRTA